MKASILDLRYRMNEILKALDRRERVKILYHGKLKGEIIPVHAEVRPKSAEHPMFGLLKGETEDPNVTVSKMRRRQFDDL
jgi:hypothetical protein